LTERPYRERRQVERRRVEQAEWTCEGSSESGAVGGNGSRIRYQRGAYDGMR